MYRAIALYLLRQGVQEDQEETMEKLCWEAKVTLAYEEGQQQVFLNGENVSSQIRTEEVSRMASVSSAKKAVRASILDLQRDLARKTQVVMDGRDIGSNVLPDAGVKIYLTASVETRAKRRYDEMKEKGADCSLEEIMEDIKERDYRDMHREIAPLVQTEDAVCIDSSRMTIEEVKEAILEVYRKAGC
jgi:cytidylate kinase